MGGLRPDWPPPRVGTEEDRLVRASGERTFTRRALGRYLLALLTGAVVGVVLGLWGASWRSDWGSSSWLLVLLTFIISLGATTLLVVVLLLAAVAHRRPAEAVAALAMVGGFVLGIVIAPGAQEDSRQSAGSGAASTRDDPTPLWSGPITCRWVHGQATYQSITGFDVPIADFEIVPGVWVRDAALTEVAYKNPDFVGDGHVSATVLATDSRGNGTGYSTLIEIGSRSGTAVLPWAGNVVLTWTCSDGP